MAVQFIRFGVVGCLGLVVDFAATFLLKEKLSANKYLANAVGFSLAVSFNYALNRVWTFASDAPVAFEYVKFVGVSVVGLALNHALLLALHKRRNISFYVSKAMAIVVVFVYNFFANLWFTF